MATHYYAVSWDQLHRDARALAWRLMEQGPFAGIVAITRGGLIPAAIIARELDVRLVESVSIVDLCGGQQRHADRGGEARRAGGDQAAGRGRRRQRVPDRR